MERISNVESIASPHYDGYYNTTDFTTLAIAQVLNSSRLMFRALNRTAMLTPEAAHEAFDDATTKVANPHQYSMAPQDLTAIRKQARDWLKDHGTTLTAIKRDYNSAAYTACYMLGLRTIVEYEVPEILADLIARTGKYATRELMEA